MGGGVGWGGLPVDILLSFWKPVKCSHAGARELFTGGWSGWKKLEVIQKGVTAV